jgi:hypothetical protein
MIVSEVYFRFNFTLRRFQLRAVGAGGGREPGR